MSPVRPTVVGHRPADDDRRLRDLLTRSAQPFEWLEAGTTEADAILQAVGRLNSELPESWHLPRDPLAPALVHVRLEELQREGSSS